MKVLKKLTVIFLCVLILEALTGSFAGVPCSLQGMSFATSVRAVQCCWAETAAKVPTAIYGEYTLLKTLDIKGNVKVPEYTVQSLVIKENNTYELVLYENASGNRDSSNGSMIAWTDNDLAGYGGLADQEWQFELRDDRNDEEPSYVFVIDARDDGSICVLWIPQGVGDNSWLLVADYWFLEKTR